MRSSHRGWHGRIRALALVILSLTGVSPAPAQAQGGGTFACGDCTITLIGCYGGISGSGCSTVGYGCSYVCWSCASGSGCV
jgi:hypothetical protein